MSEQAMDSAMPVVAGDAALAESEEKRIAAAFAGVAAFKRGTALAAEAAVLVGCALLLPALWDISLGAPALLGMLGIKGALSGAALGTATVLLRLVAFAPFLAFLVLDLSERVAGEARHHGRDLGEVPAGALKLRDGLCGIAPTLFVVAVAAPVGLSATRGMARQLKWTAEAASLVSVAFLVIALVAGIVAWRLCRAHEKTAGEAGTGRSPAACAAIAGGSTLLAPAAAVAAVTLIVLAALCLAAVIGAIFLEIIKVLTGLAMLAAFMLILPFIPLMAWSAFWR